ncbi:hypothetical protein CYLTODRAFT_170214 [Cylindrobasidium torrendii FP15055 ss-10]|uniref:Uncharacterized protein n=1 Tax=Cylindrobasidium torrendii FP15055 ss-10 TaxID=1314674 RepID=A0A0D7AZ73_9AGAR|nr:hypothetical protein CYLTODRAFT_170214 [Cylindrobasidium torrendii FP15055 ss-10]
MNKVVGEDAPCGVSEMDAEISIIVRLNPIYSARSSSDDPGTNDLFSSPACSSRSSRTGQDGSCRSCSNSSRVQATAGLHGMSESLLAIQAVRRHPAMKQESLLEGICWLPEAMFCCTEGKGATSGHGFGRVREEVRFERSGSKRFRDEWEVLTGRRQ